MTEAIGVRIDPDFLQKIEELSQEEAVDRSTMIRKLSLIGYKEFLKEKTAREYLEGKITMSEAAHRAAMNIFDLEKYLISKGFVSSFSAEDLKKELRLLS